MKRLMLRIIFAILAIAMAIVFYVHTLHLPKAAYQLPRILIVIVILLSIAMVIEGVMTYKKQRSRQTPKPGRPQEQLPPTSPEAGLQINLVRVVVFTILIAGYVLTIERLGYFIITPIYIIVTYAYLRATNWLNMILIAVGFTVFVYVLFVLFLHLPVPMGLMSS